jgi:hypothetical protein
MPVPGEHTPASWHWFEATHTTGLPPVQAPAWQVSVWVQAFPSTHNVPLVAFGFEHTPVPGLHTPATWHGSLAVHTTGFEPMQAPAEHESLCVQALPSEHDVPSANGEPEQTPAWHVPSWVHVAPPPHAVPLAFDGFEQTPVAVSQTPARWH